MSTLTEDGAAVQLILPDGDPWLPPEPVDSDARAVLAILRRPGVHTREDLARATGLADRAIRKAIAILRLQGWPVVASSSSAGYRVTFDATALDELERDLTARALAALRVRSRIRRIRERRAA